MTKNYKDIKKDVFSEDFKKFCEENIIRYLSQFELQRKIRLFGMTVTYILGIIFIINHFDGDIPNKIFVLFGTAICTLIINIIIKGSYQADAKDIILPKLISYVGNLRIIEKGNPERFKHQNYVAKLEIIPHFNDMTFDDFFAGNYNDIEFLASEFDLKFDHVEESTDTVFKGLLISFKSFKEFNKNILIPQKGRLSSYVRIKKHNYKKINFGNRKFDKLFDAYCADEEEAKSLVTPAFINRMIQLSKKPFTKEIFASFENGMVNIFIPTKKDLFELPPITKSITNIKNYQNVVLDLLFLFSIVDTLKIEENVKTQQ